MCIHIYFILYTYIYFILYILRIYIEIIYWKKYTPTILLSFLWSFALSIRLFRACSLFNLTRCVACAERDSNGNVGIAYLRGWKRAGIHACADAPKTHVVTGGDRPCDIARGSDYQNGSSGEGISGASDNTTAMMIATGEGFQRAALNSRSN